MSATCLNLKSLSVNIDGNRILDNASLEIDRGRCVALLGPSGSGKTTILRAIAGFVSVKGGEVEILGKNVTKLLPERRPVSMLFQDPVLFHHMTVRENASIGLSTSKSLPPSGLTIKQLAEILEIDNCLGRITGSLSGGEKQRAALLRTFANAKDLLLLDEPLKSALNVELRWNLMKAIRSLTRMGAQTSIIVTHDFEEAAYLADEIAVIPGMNEPISKGTVHKMYNAPDSLQVARVLGKGTELDEKLVFDKKKSEAYCPFLFENGRPERPHKAHRVFIRPGMISIIPGKEGFKVVNISFLGDYSLVELEAMESEAGKKTRIFASANEDMLKKLEKDHIVGAKLKSEGIIAFDIDEKRVAK